jgi:hypothetical protein
MLCPKKLRFFYKNKFLEVEMTQNFMAFSKGWTHLSVPGSLSPWSVDEEVDWECDDIVNEDHYHDEGHEQVRHDRHDEIKI